MSVNNVVNEIEILYIGAIGIPTYYTLTRGTSPFLTNDFTFNSAQLITNCCADVQITLTAKSFCDGIASVNFVWQKEDVIGFLTPNLPNVITPDGDGIDDTYCFHAKGCNYEMLVINSMGTTVYSETGDINSSFVCTNWTGQSNPDLGIFILPGQLTNGTYFVDITLYNDCGGEVSKYGYLHLISGQYMPVNDDITTTVIQNKEILSVNSITNENKIILITNVLGQVISRENFTSLYTKNLETGIYFVNVLTEKQELILSQKIIIHN